MLPQAWHPQIIRLTIRGTHHILSLQYEISELASAGVGGVDNHPVLSAAGDIIQGGGPRTSSRMKACNKGRADLKALIDAFSSEDRDFNFPSAWRASCPAMMVGDEPTTKVVLGYIMSVWFSYFAGGKHQEGFPKPRSTRALLSLARNDYRAMYWGLYSHSHLRSLLTGAEIASSKQFRAFLLAQCQAWEEVIDNAKAVMGPVGIETVQSRPIFGGDLEHVSRVIPWSVTGHRDYSAMTLFAKLGPRAEALLCSTSWSAQNLPAGSNNWRITISDTKVYGHEPTDEVIVWFREYDGFRFGCFYNNQNKVRSFLIYHCVNLCHLVDGNVFFYC